MASRVGRRLSAIVLGVLVGLGLSELLFRWRDDGAYPHLNVYRADPSYGVRLQPLASTRVRFGGGQSSNVYIHSGGFRGEAAGPEPTAQKGEVLFVGDSQTFGLGVEASQAFAARFGQIARRPVYNAGVPTWGPPEFSKAMRELGARRHPDTIVYVVNFANDPFEAERPNAQRHAVWDGWAVRREHAPAHVTEFPGRELLFSRSHLVLALRKWWHAQSLGTAEEAERGLPSEGTFRDLFKLGQTFAQEQLQARAETERRAKLYESEATYAQEAYRLAESRVRAIVWEELKLYERGAAGYDPNAQGSVYLAADANPGDIVTPGVGEEGQPVYATAVYIRQAVELRKRFEAQVKQRAQAALEGDAAKAALAALSERDQERIKLAAVRSKPLEIVRASSPLTRAVLAAKAEADTLGARFALLVLPIDVMVSDAEWPKHGTKHVDLAPAQVLIQDLLDSVREAGGVALDASDALKKAEPGAFLPGDIHMTPKGHDAVAHALVSALADTSSTTPTVPALVLPKDRSRVPPPSTWDSMGGEVAVNGSSRCPVTRKYREWLYVTCYADSPQAPQGTGLQVTKGGLGDAITWLRDGRMTLVAPIPPGQELEALFTWSDGMTKRLLVSWDATNVAPEMRMLIDKQAPSASAPDKAAADRVCACFQVVHPHAACGAAVANADANCAATYPDDCSKLLACAEGDALYPPRCPAPQVNVGASLHCGLGPLVPPTDKPTPPLAPTQVSGAPPSATELDAAADTLIAAAQAFVGKDCQLGSDEVELVAIVPYDRCKTDEARVTAYQKALADFDGLAARAKLSGNAQSFREKSVSFGQFVRQALQTQDTRGTAAFLQDLALAHNAWRPQKAVPVDAPAMVALYFGLSGHGTTDYFRNLHKDGAKRQAAYEASGQHFQWKRGPNGFEGPYLEGDSRIVGGY